MKQHIYISFYIYKKINENIKYFYDTKKYKYNLLEYNIPKYNIPKQIIIINNK